MSSFSELTQDYATKPVPKDKTVPGWQIALVKIGVVLALPAFIIGAQLGDALGLTKSSLAFFLGGLILAVLGCLTGTIGARSGLSTAMITRFAFGRRGATLVSVMLAISLLGWFGVTVDLFGKSLNSTVIKLFEFDLGEEIYIVGGGVLMIVTTIFGFSALQRLADLVVPILLIGLFWVCWLALEQADIATLLAVEADKLSLGLAVSAVVGSMVVGVTIFPDICRFAHNATQGKIAALLSFGLAVPVILVLSAIPSLVSGEKDLILIMLGLGLGVAALLLLVFTAWTTNAGNLYSSTLAFETLATQTAKWKLTSIIGAIGTLLAIFGITSYLISILVLVGVCIPPIAGIYIADFYYLRGRQYDIDRLASLPDFNKPAFIAWAIASSIGYLTSQGIFSLTTIPSCDSVLIAFLLYYLFIKAYRPLQQTAASPNAL